jgi:hypothetical protein
MLLANEPNTRRTNMIARAHTHTQQDDETEKYCKVQQKQREQSSYLSWRREFLLALLTMP